MPNWLLVVIVVAVLVPIRLAYDVWIYRELYVRGRTPAEAERADQFRNRALLFLGAAVALDFAQRHAPQIRALPYLEGAALAPAFYYIIRATQRVSTGRTLASLFLLVLGFATLIAALWLGKVPGRAGFSFGPTSIGAIILGLSMFVVAARLSRP